MDMDDKTATGEIVGAESAAVTSPIADEVRIDFSALKLRPGMFLQAQPFVPGHPIAEGTPTYEAQFLGIIEGKGVMVVPHGTSSLKNGMPAGKNFILRGFTGRYDFHFASQVIRIYDYSFRDPPLAFALLSYPTTVETRQVRRALRVRVSLPATVSPISENRPVAVTLVDLSVAGSLINSPAPLGAIGDAVTVMFAIEFEDEKLDLLIPASICRIVNANQGDGYLTGVLFTEINRSDKLALHYFVHSTAE